MNYLLTAVLLLTIGAAQAETRCEVVLKPAGIYYYTCPTGFLVDGVDAYHPGPSPYPTVRVRCVKPEVICKEVKENKDQ